jgi:hypothetical protein
LSGGDEPVAILHFEEDGVIVFRKSIEGLVIARDSADDEERVICLDGEEVTVELLEDVEISGEDVAFPGGGVDGAYGFAGEVGGEFDVEMEVFVARGLPEGRAKWSGGLGIAGGEDKDGIAGLGLGDGLERRISAREDGELGVEIVVGGTTEKDVCSAAGGQE